MDLSGPARETRQTAQWTNHSPPSFIIRLGKHEIMTRDRLVPPDSSLLNVRISCSSSFVVVKTEEAIRRLLF